MRAGVAASRGTNELRRRERASQQLHPLRAGAGSPPRFPARPIARRDAPLARRGAPRRQLCRRPRMCGEPPATRRGLVDRCAYERVAEDKPPRDRRRAQKITREQRIEGSEPIRSRQLGNRRCQIRLERLTGHRSGLEQPSLGRGERRQLLGKRRRDSLRDAAPSTPAPLTGAVSVTLPPTRASCSR